MNSPANIETELLFLRAGGRAEIADKMEAIYDSFDLLIYALRRDLDPTSDCRFLAQEIDKVYMLAATAPNRCAREHQAQPLCRI